MYKNTQKPALAKKYQIPSIFKHKYSDNANWSVKLEFLWFKKKICELIKLADGLCACWV